MLSFLPSVIIPGLSAMFTPSWDSTITVYVPRLTIVMQMQNNWLCKMSCHFFFFFVLSMQDVASW